MPRRYGHRFRSRRTRRPDGASPAAEASASSSSLGPADIRRPRPPRRHGRGRARGSGSCRRRGGGRRGRRTSPGGSTRRSPPGGSETPWSRRAHAGSCASAASTNRAWTPRVAGVVGDRPADELEQLPAVVGGRQLGAHVPVVGAHLGSGARHVPGAQLLGHHRRLVEVAVDVGAAGRQRHVAPVGLEEARDLGDVDPRQQVGVAGAGDALVHPAHPLDDRLGRRRGRVRGDGDEGAGAREPVQRLLPEAGRPGDDPAARGCRDCSMSAAMPPTNMETSAWMRHVIESVPNRPSSPSGTS